MKNGINRAAAALLLAPSASLAQSPANVPSEDGGLLTWGIAAALAVLILIGAFWNPKRSHLT